MERAPKQKSLKLNMFFNAIKGIMSIIFPLVSFPYASTVLGVDNIGRYGFADSIISYFLLFADLGISTYAIREGAKIRSKRNKINIFASEMFSFNCISSLCSLGLLAFCMIVVPKFQSYRTLLFVMSIQILFKAIGVEWIYSVYEEYAYITIRTVCFQIISIFLLFLLVKTDNDINVYAGINVVAVVLINIVNFVRSRKYCHIKLKRNIDYKLHIKSIMILFFINIT